MRLRLQIVMVATALVLVVGCTDSDSTSTPSAPPSTASNAGVPCVIRATGDRLVAVSQWFPFDDRSAFDRVAVAFSDDEGRSWSRPTAVKVTGLPSDLTRPFDPVVVQLADGRWSWSATCAPTPARAEVTGAPWLTASM